MRSSARLTAIAGAATALGTAPLGALFDSLAWIFPTTAAIAMVTGGHLLARMLRMPAVLVPGFGLVGLVLFLTWAFAPGTAFFGLLPLPGTGSALRAVFESGMDDVHGYGTPAPVTRGLMFLVAFSGGLVAILVDTIAVAARRPAGAGLAMLALYAVPTAISNRSIGWVWFAAGAGGYLLLLVAEERDRLLRWGRPVRPTDPANQGDPAPLKFSGRQVGFAALAVAVIVPLLVPGLPVNGLYGLASNGDGTGDGDGRGGTALDPFIGLKGRLQDTVPKEMMRLSVTGDTNPFNIRVQTIDMYDNDTGWRPRQPAGNQSLFDRLTPARTDLTGARPLTAHITITEYNDANLPILWETVGVSGLTGARGWQYDSERDMIYSRSATTDRKQYDLQVLQPNPSIEQLRASPPVTDPGMQRWLQKPSDLPQEVRTIVADIVKNAQNPYDRARAIHDYFSPENGFTYSLSTRPGNTGNVLTDFLTSGKQGYCEQYAAAMGIMLREAGVPSRLVIGFATPQRRDDGTWSVMTDDAHAWVEAYFQGYGWIPFDPTPADPNTDAGRLNEPWAPRHEVTVPTTGPEPSDVPTSSAGASGSTQPADNGEQTPGALEGSGGSGISGGQLLTVGVLLVALLVLGAPALTRVAWRRRRLRQAGGPDAALAARASWDELLATAVDLGVPLVATESPRATAARLTRELSLSDQAAAALRLLALAEERARYAPTATVDGDLPEAVRAVRRGLRADHRRRRRLRATLLPPSVLQALRSTLAARTDRVSRQVDRLSADVRRATTLRGRRPRTSSQ